MIVRLWRLLKLKWLFSLNGLPSPESREIYFIFVFGQFIYVIRIIMCFCSLKLPHNGHRTQSANQFLGICLSCVRVVRNCPFQHLHIEFTVNNKWRFFSFRFALFWRGNIFRTILQYFNHSRGKWKFVLSEVFSLLCGAARCWSRWRRPTLLLWYSNMKYAACWKLTDCN